MIDQPDPHPDMRPLIEARDAMPPAKTVAEQRANWTQMSEALRAPCPEDMTVTMDAAPRPDGSVPLRVYKPAGANGSAILYFHGGGFMKGDLDSGDTVAWGYAQETGAAVFSVDYRLTPEHAFPAAFDDCYAALEYVAGKALDYGIDPGRIAVAGDSAGGNLAAAVSLAARDRNGPQIAAQVLVYPMLGLNLALGTAVTAADAPGLTKKGLSEYWLLYLNGAEVTDNPYAAPLVGADFAALPPAFIHTAELDPLCDDGVVYADRLKAAGTTVTYRCAERMIHGFTRIRHTGPAVKHEFDLLCGFLKEHLDL